MQCRRWLDGDRTPPARSVLVRPSAGRRSGSSPPLGVVGLVAPASDKLKKLVNMYKVREEKPITVWEIEHT